MKKILIALLAIMMVFVLASCEEPEAAPKGETVTVEGYDSVWTICTYNLPSGWDIPTVYSAGFGMTLDQEDVSDLFVFSSLQEALDTFSVADEAALLSKLANGEGNITTDSWQAGLAVKRGGLIIISNENKLYYTSNVDRPDKNDAKATVNLSNGKKVSTFFFGL